MLEAWPVYAIFMHRLHEAPLPGLAQAGIVTSFATAFTLTLAVFLYSVHYGIRRLATIEP